MRRVPSTANRYDLPAVYDAYYLSLTEVLGIRLWTADRRLRRAIQETKDSVPWIGDYR
jgi:predicted nucleic acid-binding protein